MKRTWATLAIAPVILGLAGCSRGPATMPTKKVPAGLVRIEFTRKVKGPVDLALDGVRIPVEQTAKGGSALVISGLSAGKHRFFLSSPLDAFGPDQGEVEVKDGTGTYLLLFSQNFKATLYGKVESLPKPEGLPGVKAKLEK